MLAPKRVLHRKVQRGSMKGQAKGNTELRDNCASLDDFCHLHNVDKAALVSKLKAAGFEYNAELKKFW